MLKTFLPRSIPSPSKRSQKRKYDRIWLKQDAKPTIFNFLINRCRRRTFIQWKLIWMHIAGIYFTSGKRAYRLMQNIDPLYWLYLFITFNTCNISVKYILKKKEYTLRYRHSCMKSQLLVDSPLLSPIWKLVLHVIYTFSLAQ